MSENPTDNIPVFYACIPEAADGPPIEIAWATLGFKTYGVLCESRLIKPPAAWGREFARDPSALEAYGLDLSDLREFGTPTRVLAAHMNETLAKRDLFSATLADDARLKRIFDAAKMAPEFGLLNDDAEELIAELARLRGLSPTACVRSKREAEVMCLTGVRAEAQARYFATYWGSVMRGN